MYPYMLSSCSSDISGVIFQHWVRPNVEKFRSARLVIVYVETLFDKGVEGLYWGHECCRGWREVFRKEEAYSRSPSINGASGLDCIFWMGQRDHI
ncbi:hypothetical protein TNIN_315591 [Trichonephila inaurata madagascariensis]|uniref:Uncharacterized protein n=1 Tax=Trichonephila inaurata madagascariensis TaxID=2747483 RepID=A0A8X6WLV4_9ARAC|nr:hypothetical protein TNIN_315591 [Trichonephila inaurata madagascariensis]